MVTQAIITLMLIGFGILFALGKGAFLIAGYNTMSAEERAKYDEKKLMKNMSLMMFSCAACTGVGLIGSIIKQPGLVNLGFILMVPCVLYFIIRVNTKSRR